MADSDDIQIEEDTENSEPSLESSLKKIKKELKEAKAEAAEYLAGWQRSKADYVNLSRRMREEKELVLKQVTASLAEGIIAVFDSVEAARASASRDDVSSLTTGIEQIQKQLEKTLRDLGVERFSPLPGDHFNPLRHEPMRTVACEAEREDNTILETLQSGFCHGDTVIRPARVVVKHFNQ